MAYAGRVGIYALLKAGDALKAPMRLHRGRESTLRAISALLLDRRPPDYPIRGQALDYPIRGQAPD